MRKLKRTLTTVLSLMLVLTLLGACTQPGGSATTNAGSSATTAKPAATTKAAGTPPPEVSKDPEFVYSMGQPVTDKDLTISILTHTGWGSTFAVPNNDVPVYAAIQERLGVNIEWKILENATYAEQFNARLMAKDLADLVVPLTRATVPKMVADGYCVSYEDLDFENNAPYASYLIASDPDYATILDTFRQYFPDGRLYGFGSTIVTRYLFGNILVNNFWLDKLGMSEPATVDEFLEMLRAFRDNDPNGNGLNDEIPLAYGSDFYHGLAYGNVFSLDFNVPWSLDGNGKIINENVTDKYRDFIEFRKKLYDEGLIDKEERTADANYELVAQDKVGAFVHLATFSATLSGYSPYADEGITFPVFREIIPLNNIYTNTPVKYSRLNGGSPHEGLYIMTGAAEPEVCLRIADWLWASDESLELVNYGVEGVSFEVGADGSNRLIQPADYSGSVPYLTHIGGTQWPMAGRQVEAIWRQTNRDWIVERADMIKPYYADLLAPFVFTPEQAAENSRIQTDVNTFVAEWTSNFITGRTPLSQWDAYLEGLNKIGLPELTRVHQENYDARNK